jgi:ornithine cyclodeaminase/alanine dehydrogenase-like protein (mu-crystallin family)
VIKRAFVQLSTGKANVPTRIQIDVPKYNGTTLFMPGYLEEDQQMAVKIVSVFRDNTARGLPSINALVVVIDPQTGLCSSILDGTALTALRTGAAAGAATDLLARQDAGTAAIFGAGVQARTQIEAVCSVRPITEAWVFDVNTEAARGFALEMTRRLSIPIHVAENPSEAATGADIICTVTTSATPVFDDCDIREGTHINALGVYKTHMHEIPPETVQRARIVVDSIEACMEEAGDILIPLKKGLISEEHIYGEIGQIASGLKAGRENNQEITLFKSVGIAVQDVAAAGAVLESAERLNLGNRIEI